MEGESVKHVGDELESVTSSAGWSVQGWRNETSTVLNHTTTAQETVTSCTDDD